MDKHTIKKSITYKYFHGGTITAEEAKYLVKKIKSLRKKDEFISHHSIMKSLSNKMEDYWIPLEPGDTHWYKLVQGPVVLYWLRYAKTITICRNIPGHPTVAVFKIKK